MKRDVWKETWFSVIVGIITTMMFIHIKPEWAPYTYLPGVIYGVLGYECWLILVETWPYDNGGEPMGFDAKQACIATGLPVGFVVVVACFLGLLCLATIWTLWQLVTGRLEFDY